MKYNYVDIGNRIRNERKSIGYSQDDLINELKERGISVSRNTISAIESGKTNHYDSDLLFALCDLFNCELGYLLCEYDCKTGRNTDICSDIGLTENAVNVLRNIYSDNRQTSHTNIISTILESESLYDTLELISLSISARNPQVGTMRETPIAKLDWGNVGKNIRCDDLIDSLISTRIINAMREISYDYLRKYGTTPLTQYREYLRSLVGISDNDN